MLHETIVQYQGHRVYTFYALIIVSYTVQNVEMNNGGTFLNGKHASLIVLDKVVQLFPVVNVSAHFHKISFVKFYMLSHIFLLQRYTNLKRATKSVQHDNRAIYGLIESLMQLSF